MHTFCCFWDRFEAQSSVPQRMLLTLQLAKCAKQTIALVVLFHPLRQTLHHLQKTRGAPASHFWGWQHHMVFHLLWVCHMDFREAFRCQQGCWEFIGRDRTETNFQESFVLLCWTCFVKTLNEDTLHSHISWFKINPCKIPNSINKQPRVESWENRVCDH